MATEKACKLCGRIIEEGKECVVCKNRDLSTSFKGIILILDPENSEIAELSEKKVPGRYALKVL